MAIEQDVPWATISNLLLLKYSLDKIISRIFKIAFNPLEID